MATQATVQNMLPSVNLPKGVDHACRRRIRVPCNEALLKSLFKRFDTDRDGRLNKEELRNAFASLGSHVPGWRAFRGLHQADCNGDGYVSDDELDDLVKYALKYGYTINFP